MSIDKIYNIYKTMEQENVMLSFNGVITADFLTVVLEIIETKMDHLDESSKTKKKVFNVLVECLQNLYHHIEDDDESKKHLKKSKSALIMVVRNEDGYYIQTGNYIDRTIVTELEERLIKINTLEKEQLREYYKEVLSNGNISEKGTAGLGMIDIARKSGNKLDFKFLDIDQDFSFFSLNVKIN